MPEYTPNYNGGRPMTAPPATASSEYSRAYPSTINAPRPRNPVPTWSTRNRSNILPSHPEPRPVTSSQSARTQQQWPWQERAIRSEIFANPEVVDVNNNPSVPVMVIPEPLPRYRAQRRGQASSGIFFFDRLLPDLESNDIRPVRPNRKWPWQERAMQSKIFQLPEEKQHIMKSYKWDQRKSSPFFEEDDAVLASMKPIKIHKTWPWQERAQQSHIFKAPNVELQPGKKYLWDQRQSVFDIKNDENAKFEAVSWYSNDFIKNKKDLSRLEAAGIKSYQTLEALKNLTINSAKEPKDIVPLFKTNPFTYSSTSNHNPASNFRDRTNTHHCSNVLPSVQVKREFSSSKGKTSTGTNSENKPPVVVDLTK